MPSLKCGCTAGLDREEARSKKTKQEAAIGIQEINEARLNSQ